MIEASIYELWNRGDFSKIIRISRSLPVTLMGELPAQALNLMGVACCIKEDLSLAATILSVAYAKRPNDPDIILNLGNCLKDQKQFAAAREIYRGSTHIDADPSILVGAGICELELRNYDDCFAIFNIGLKKYPSDAPINYNAARIFGKLEQWDKAREHYKKALELDPTYSAAAHGLAESAAAGGDLKYALGMAEQILEAGDLSNEFVAAFTSKLLSIGAAHQAVEYFELCREKAEFNEFPYHMAAEAAKTIKLSGQCIEYCTEALRQKPNFMAARVNLYHAYSEAGDYRKGKEVRALINKTVMHEQELPPNPWSMFSVTDGAEQLYDTAINYSKFHFSGLTRREVERRIPSEDGKLRVGFLSADYGEHPVAECVLPLFRNRPDWVEIHALSMRPADVRDSLTDTISEAVDHYHECKNFSYDQMRELCEEKIDVLVDLAGHTAGGAPQFIALGLARPQINFLGFSGTTGMEAYDFIVGDSFIFPEGVEEFYSEKLIRLDAPMLSVALKSPSSIPPCSREKYGIPEDIVLFACIAQAYKYSDDLIRCWSEILTEVPRSGILLAYAPSDTQANIANALFERGVMPEQIYFATREPTRLDHLSRLTIADIFLDTFPYNAHSLAADALSAGVPLVTLSGESFASRVAGSLLAGLGLECLIAKDFSEYKEIAIRYGKSEVDRSQARAKLRERLEDRDWHGSYAQEFFKVLRGLGRRSGS